MRLITASILFFLSLMSFSLWSEVLKSSAVEFAFLDVGQGDAIYIETPHGHQVLIDGGPDKKVLFQLSTVMPYWDKTLDVLVLTHPDADHSTGLIAVLESFKVSTIVWTGKTADTRVFKAWQEAAEKEGAQFVVVRAGERIVLGDSGATLSVLYPFKDTNIEEQSTNETSLIALFEYKGNTVLLTGDTTKEIERVLVESGAELEADILKVAHHGSSTSSSRGFLSRVNPKTAVISVGEDNRFGHPTQDVLANLAEYGIVVARTDHEGTIRYYFK